MQDSTTTIVAIDAIDRQFQQFHNDNPEVFAQLRALALRWVEAGASRVGIATLFETLRYTSALAGVRDGQGYRLNNNYRSRYARLLMEQEPRLAGLFQLRTIRAAA